MFASKSIEKNPGWFACKKSGTIWSAIHWITNAFGKFQCVYYHQENHEVKRKRNYCTLHTLPHERIKLYLARLRPISAQCDKLFA